MTVTVATARARRYLLGQVSEEECAAIEREYLEQEDALERMAAAEDELIEEYLANELTVTDRRRFEQAYLSAPHHRVRVETIRRLMTRTSQNGSGGGPQSTAPSDGSVIWLKRATPIGPWLALAASILIAAPIVLWVLRPFVKTQREAASGRIASVSVPTPRDGTTSTPSTKAARIFAVTVSPVSVRSASDTPLLVIPPRTDIVTINLEAEPGTRKLVATRASIRAVDGNTVWQGAIATERNAAQGTVARIDVPVVSLPVDDYLVTLYGTDSAQVEREWTQYFLRVRMR